MGLKTIIIGLFSFFNCIAGIHAKWHPENNAKQPCYLPEGKAEHAASPALSKVRGKVLQLHP